MMMDKSLCFARQFLDLGMNTRPCQGLRSVPTCRATWTEAGSASGVDGRAVGGAGAALGGVPAEGQDAAPGPAADGGGDRLAARGRREVAGAARRGPPPAAGGPPPPPPARGPRGGA